MCHPYSHISFWIDYLSASNLAKTFHVIGRGPWLQPLLQLLWPISVAIMEPDN